METNSHPASSQKLAIGLSICLHLLLLFAGYYITVGQPASISTSYSITFTTIASPQRPKTTIKKPTSPSKKTATQVKPKPKPTSTTTPPKPPKEKAVDSEKELEEAPAPQEQEENKVDERGLYQAQPGQQTSAKLDLIGWMWDTTPQPQDETDESGKIVFEIKIDELGEVIAVKTLEKTVSPLVEKIYKDALTELTFSRTADNIAYAPIYVGRVSFILRTR
ncbi:MAG: hypothetical protein AAF963_01925 [Bacteroidota bacterium]